MAILVACLLILTRHHRNERAQPSVMKFKRFIYVGLILGVGLFGCYIAWQQHVQSFLGRLRPPNGDQVKKWAGFPEGTHLTMFTNVPDHVWYGD